MQSFFQGVWGLNNHKLKLEFISKDKNYLQMIRFQTFPQYIK